MLVLNDITKTKVLKLKKHGFAEIKATSKYESVRLKGITTLILYTSGKLVVAGSDENMKKTASLLRKEGFSVPRQEKKEAEKAVVSGTMIGTDETLKGDTFGGIVVCGFLADDEIRTRLKELKVKDSKKLNNAEIACLAGQLISTFPKKYHVESLSPKEYNKLNSKRNVTEILDILHEKCFKKLAKNMRNITHIVDEYPGCKVGKLRVKKAESKYVEVAAASIIARFEGLKQIRGLEDEAGFFIPMGSSHVEDGLMELKRKELDPVDYVKMRFKNVEKMFK
ncbi:MAG: hypothetical protein KKF44_08180 [Nanoarchaeota archaeon]|nr:hypothetical protein [Nanoarchaeota archaeon]